MADDPSPSGAPPAEPEASTPEVGASPPVPSKATLWVTGFLVVLLVVQVVWLIRVYSRKDNATPPNPGRPGGAAPVPGTAPAAGGVQVPPARIGPPVAVVPRPSGSPAGAAPVGPAPGTRAPAVSPAPTAVPAAAPPAAAPPAATAGPDMMRGDGLPRLAAGLMALEGSKVPPSAEQRQKMQKPATVLCEATGQIREDLLKVVLVLDEGQFSGLYQSHPGNPPEPVPPGGTGDPNVARLIVGLEKKAGSAGATPRALSPGQQPLPPNSERFLVVTGITWLESTPDKALTAAQARSALDAFKDVQVQLDRVAGATNEIWALLTPEQQEVVRTSGEAAFDAVSARCVLYWTQKP